jgi:ABC-type branched-subunit amino acid transport system ATPase component
MNRKSDQLGVRSSRKERGQGCGGGKSSKQRRPEAAITGVLVDQNANSAAAPQHLNRFAETFADRIVFLSDGRIVENHPAREFRERTSHPEARRYLEFLS